MREIPLGGERGGIALVGDTRLSKWHAQIKAHGQQRYLGLFTDEVEAARAYDAAASEAFGEYALLNFEGET